MLVDSVIAFKYVCVFVCDCVCVVLYLVSFKCVCVSVLIVMVWLFEAFVFMDSFYLVFSFYLLFAVLYYVLDLSVFERTKKNLHICVHNIWLRRRAYKRTMLNMRIFNFQLERNLDYLLAHSLKRVKGKIFMCVLFVLCVFTMESYTFI